MCHRRSQVLPCLMLALPGLLLALPGLLLALPGLLSMLPVTLKGGSNVILGSDTLLKLTHPSLHSTSSQTLLEAPSD